MAKQNTIKVKGTQIRVVAGSNREDYICITDIAKQVSKNSGDVVKNFFRTRLNLEFLGEWELAHNERFVISVFDNMRQNAGLPTFTLSVKEWIEKTNAIGVEAKAGRYGGTYAHKDIAFAFAYWMSPKFQIYLIKEFQRLKQDEYKRLGDPHNIYRELTKVNYGLHTEGVQSLIPKAIRGTSKEGAVYASEADLLNLVLFKCTAKQWRERNSDKKGNMRDHATILELVLLLNLEAMNSQLIEWECDQQERYVILEKYVDRQRPIIKRSKAYLRIKAAHEEQKKLKQ